MGQVQKTYKGRVTVDRNTRTEVHQDSRTQRERERGDKERAALDDAMDGELDEIDRILEENAEALANYQAEGGE